MTNPQAIIGVLQQCIQDQNIVCFYPPGSAEQLGQRVAQSGAIEKLCADWQIPGEIAYDLAKLALFDLFILVDDSGSVRALNRLRILG